MIISQKMAQPVNRKMQELVLESMVSLGRLAGRDRHRDHDIAKQDRPHRGRSHRQRGFKLRKRQHIGRVVFARVLQVQRMKLVIVA